MEPYHGSIESVPLTRSRVGSTHLLERRVRNAVVARRYSRWRPSYQGALRKPFVMAKSNSTSTPQELNSQVQSGRLQLTKAESKLAEAKERARVAKRRRKEAKEAARLAKREVKRAKAEVAEAKQALGAMEAKVAEARAAVSRERSGIPGRAGVQLAQPKPKKVRKPSRSPRIVQASRAAPVPEAGQQPQSTQEPMTGGSGVPGQEPQAESESSIPPSGTSPSGIG
jgi:hypothetical protein